MPRRRARPAQEQRALVRATPFRLRLASGQRLWAWSWGAGPVVVLAHGWEGRGSQLSAFIGPLLERGYRVIAFDAPGHGDSGGRFTDVRDFAAALHAVERREGRVHAVVAHSMGALAFTLAQRQGLDAQRAVLLAPAPSPAPALAWLARELRLSDAALERVQRELAAYAGLTWDELASGAAYDNVRASALVVYDEDDALVRPDDVRAIAARFSARTRATRGLGHNRVLRDEAVVEAAVAFLDEGRAAPTSTDGWQRFLDELDVALSMQAWS